MIFTLHTILIVVHMGIGGPVEIREPLGSCPRPPIGVPLTIDHRGCYREPVCGFVCEPGPFRVIKII